ncbi:hypothetical protein BSLG_000317 [Batrachochytrium salamandrivorans]|nr:hypothetical protein BASA62_007035 [Batrachochytrium salamandrivorans]KAJ1344802.1 hypothetical protein BSLG_000317 [Batrachochytrium salamandrivorans]
MTITKITLFLLASIVQCKAQGCFDTFTSCLQIGDQFETSTCLPLRATNQSMYSICECYRYVNRDICYNQCPNNATLQQERSTIIAPQINQTCTPAGLNPKGLPQPPPWQRFELPSASAANPAPTSGAGAAGASTTNQTGTGNTPVKGDAIGTFGTWAVWSSAAVATLVSLGVAVVA